jgi:hypothetical protein
MNSYTYRSAELEVYITVKADDEDEAIDLLEEKIRDAGACGFSLPHMWSYKLYSVDAD